MKTKAKIISVLLAALLLCAGIGTTLAYFTDSEQIHNVITTGGIDLTIIEQQEVDGKLVPYPDEPIEVLPGVSVSKVVTFKNHESPAYVRAKYSITFFDKDGNEMELTDERKAELISVFVDTENWIATEEGWFCYHKALDADETTLPFFEKAKFADFKMGNDFQESTVIISISAQAVQAENNADSPADAFGWPEE